MSQPSLCGGGPCAWRGNDIGKGMGQLEMGLGVLQKVARAPCAQLAGTQCGDKSYWHDGAVAEIEKKIIEAFEVFDHECNKTVDVREIGSIVRSLGCFPTEAELHELLAKVEEEEPTGYINLEKFLPVMTKVLLDRSYPPIPEDVLLHAFEALDENKCGYITKEELVKYLTEEGEPFTQEEMEDMLSTALDPETNTVCYRDYISMMIVDES
ncbi:PREDICTED: EF-hand calcium-binding domain-containing protein 2 [Charadrius vociferus]|uniref:EF-hand calcium-binding domain-containing protein 2 n=1 Tax=Charadrius vociferus TaxID=50402 RepID=UPI000521AC7B|nr:PREDICTED: EF-hand calcium-binding domain-containing protein 2 [Charadrius vociferus]